MNIKKITFISVLALVIIISSILMAKLIFLPFTDGENKRADVTLDAAQSGAGTQARILDENAFMKIAEEVGPTVVSVSTEYITKVRSEIYYSPFGYDNFFNRFFNDFFRDTPERELRQWGLGSGVIIDESGYILTNEHVIRGADKITVTLTDGREFRGELRGKDERSDLAIIKIEAKSLPVAKLGDSDKARIGQWAIAIGNPFGYAVQSAKPTVTVGVVSALDRLLPVAIGRGRDYSGLIQTDAAINPGNSGGPLVNIKGEVIGINVVIFSTSGGYQGIGFAIPVNTAKDILKRLIEGKKILYGWLGISLQNIDSALADYFNLSDMEGVIVAKVLPDSPAEKGGLKEGDVIRRFDREKIKDLKALIEIVGQADIGKSIVIGIIRDKKEMPVTVRIGERPSGTESRQDKVEAGESWRGLEVTRITPDIARRYRIEQRKGIIVSNVEPGSAADEAGIRPGDIIVRINNKSVNSMDDYKNIITTIVGDALIKTSRGYLVVRAPKTD
jgi:serine protease Do